jgi:DNA-binding NtrC family response regulator
MSSLQKENNRRILIIDDEADVLDFLKIFLESLGWEVATVMTPEAAFDLLLKRAYFLIISDIAMPKMDGYEFLSKIREMKYPCQIAVMTGFGYNPDHTLVKVNKAMRYPCLFKPFNRKKVAETVQQAYDKYHLDLQ